MEQTHSELHTHLMGMLSFEGWMHLLNKYNYSFKADSKNNLDFLNPSKLLPLKEVNDNKDKYIPYFTIRQGKQVSYDKLSDFYSFRSLLIKDLINDLKDDVFYENKDVESDIYLDYLEHCLIELINQDIKYVEISFSNRKIIENISSRINKNILDKIKIKFLLSANRGNSSKDFRQSSRHLAKLLENDDICVGFDIMGSETPLSYADLDSNNKNAFINKIAPILIELNKKENTSFRIHSGETKASDYNTIETLKIIDTITSRLNLKLPPPEIRIGHGIHINKNQEYLNLLKKFNCIVEINASSNFALNNIDTYDNIPYKYYLDNDIKVVLSSDGHGMYDTSAHIEDLKSILATRDNSYYSKIIKDDKDILNRKL